MICSSTSTGWKCVSRKILVIVYGHEVLTAVGITNVRSTPALDSRKLDIIKGMRNILYRCAYYEHFSGRYPEVTNEFINIIVNSASALSKRKLIQKEEHVVNYYI